MGKSKRIRSDRAQFNIDNPEKFDKTDSTRKAKLTTVVLISVIAVILVLTVTLVALEKTGTFDRAIIVVRSENYSFNALMANYLYMATYNSYYAQYGQYAEYFVNSDTIVSQMQNMLAYCEQAKNNGLALDEYDIARINASLDEIKDGTKKAGYSLAQVYGNGITLNDIKEVIKLQTLASKFQLKYEKEHFDAKTDAEIEKYYQDNKTSLLNGAYISAETDDAEWRTELKKVGTAEDFEKTFIKLYVDKNYADKCKAEKSDIAEATVELLKETVKDAIAYRAFNILPNDRIEFSTELADATDISSELLNKIYDEKYKGDSTAELNADELKAIATAASALKTSISQAVTVKSAYSYPTKSDVDNPTYNTTKADAATDTSDSSTTVADNTAESTTVTDTQAADTTTANTAPADADMLSEFDAWFFEGNRKTNEFYTNDPSRIIMVTEAAEKNETPTKNVAHILVKVNTELEVHDHSDEEATEAAHNKAFEAIKPTADAILNEYNSGEKTFDAFKALAQKKTQDSGIEYYNVRRGEMVKEFEDWIYSEDRKAGDVDIVKTDYGYHVMYFIGDGVADWKVEIADKLVSEDLEKDAAEWAKSVSVDQSAKKKVFG